MRTIPCRRVAGLGALMAAAVLPGLCAAQMVLPSPVPLATRSLPDPAGVQVVRLPDGSSVKRLPGDDGATATSAARVATAAAPAGAKIVQNGNVLMLAGREEAATASLSAVPVALVARQVGDTRVLELRGQPTLGADTTTAAQAVPRGVRVVDLPAGAPLPLQPEPNTLYRRLRD